jgi:hypothetical protein
LEELGKFVKPEISGKDRTALVKQISMETFERAVLFILNFNDDAFSN